MYFFSHIRLKKAQQRYNAQVCDANEDDQRTAAGSPILILLIKSYIPWDVEVAVAELQKTEAHQVVVKAMAVVPAADVTG